MHIPPPDFSNMGHSQFRHYISPLSGKLLIWELSSSRACGKQWCHLPTCEFVSNGFRRSKSLILHHPLLWKLLTPSCQGRPCFSPWLLWWVHAPVTFPKIIMDKIIQTLCEQLINACHRLILLQIRHRHKFTFYLFLCLSTVFFLKYGNLKMN